MHIWPINSQQRCQVYKTGKDSLFNNWKNGVATCKKMKQDRFLLPFTKINSKWIRNLNVSPETIKLLEANTGSKLPDIGPGDNFLNLKPKVAKAKINKWD